jgi:D-aspartate ligase
MANKPVAIVLSRAVTGLETVRCLGSAGIPVHAIYFKKNDPVQFSRYCRATYFGDLPPSDQELLDYVAGYASGLGPLLPIVIPTCDSHALLLAQHSEWLRPSCRVMTAPYSNLIEVINKDRLLEWVKIAGLEVIPTLISPSEPQAEEWSRIHPGPYLIKPFYTGVPASRLGKRKNIVLDTRQALRAFVSDGDMQSLLVQRIIRGGDGYIFDCYGYCNRQGQVVAMATKRRLRQNLPNYGTCTMGEIPARLDETTENSLLTNTRKLFEHLPYHGIFGVEWLFDRESGRFYLIDFNARPFMSIGHVAAAGLNLPLLAYSEMIGNDLIPADPLPPLRHLIGVDVLRDMESFHVKRQCGELTTAAWLASLARCRHFDYTDWRDPGPALCRALEIFRRAGKYLLRAVLGAIF